MARVALRPALLATLLAAAPALAGLAAARAQAAPESLLPQLAWLAGCWALDEADAGSGEVWTAPAGGTMFGISRTVKNGRTVGHEFMQIRDSAVTRLVFVAMPSGQKETSFPLARLEAGEVVFENLGHDFPQRIAYRRLSPTQVEARIEGLRPGGILRTIQFPLRRADCAAPAPAR